MNINKFQASYVKKYEWVIIEIDKQIANFIIFLLDKLIYLTLINLCTSCSFVYHTIFQSLLSTKLFNKL